MGDSSSGVSPEAPGGQGNDSPAPPSRDEGWQGYTKRFRVKHWVTAMFPAAGSGFRMIDPGENAFSPGLDIPKTPGQIVDRGLSERSGAAAGRCNTSILVAPHRKTPIS